MSESSGNGALAQAAARVGGNLAALLGARIFAMALSLVQNAIIFRALTESAGTEETGRFGYTLGFASFFTVFASLGMQRLLVRNAARDGRDAWAQAWTGLAVLAGLSLLCMAAIGLSLRALGEPQAVIAAAVWAGVSVVLVWAVQQPFEALIMARERMASLAAVYALTAAMKLAAIHWAMARLPTAWNAHAAIAGANIAGLILIAGLAFRVCGWSRPRVDLRMARRQIRDSLAYTAAMLFSLLYFKSDIVLLKYISGEAAAGQYTPVQRLMEPLLMIAALWGTALFPALCRMAHREDAGMARLQASNLRLSLLVSVPMAAGLFLLAEPILHLLTGDATTYADGVLLLRLFALVTPLFYWNSLGQEALYAAGRRWSVAATYAAAALVNIGVNVLAVPRFGVVAVAWAALLANALISTVFLWKMRRLLGTLRLPGLLLRVAAASAAMGAIAWPLAGQSLALACIAGGLGFAAVLLLLRPFDDFEREMLRALIASVLRLAGKA